MGKIDNKKQNLVIKKWVNKMNWLMEEQWAYIKRRNGKTWRKRINGAKGDKIKGIIN